jgi:hypothetical protein
VQVGDVDDAGGELQDARLIGEQLEFRQGLADGGARFERGEFLVILVVLTIVVIFRSLRVN